MAPAAAARARKSIDAASFSKVFPSKSFEVDNEAGCHKFEEIVGRRATLKPFLGQVETVVSTAAMMLISEGNRHGKGTACTHLPVSGRHARLGSAIWIFNDDDNPA
jgi:hypothetical protein